MTTMQKFKAYFGMVPPSEYEDDYLADPMSDSGQHDIYGDAPVRRPASAGHRDETSMSARERLYLERYRPTSHPDSYYADETFADEPYREASFRDEVSYAEADYGIRGEGERVYAERAMHVEVDRAPAPAPARGRLEPLSRSANVSGRGGMAPVRGANALAAEFSPTESRIATLRPSDYSEARTIGERFRDGSPVIMDLVDMSNDDAKRMVDFAAGLVFALRGSFDKVATKVFLLSPAGVEVTPEDRRRLAESGFHNQS